MHSVLEGLGVITISELQAAVTKASELLPGARLRLSGSQWIADAAAPVVLQLNEYPSFQGDISHATHNFSSLDPKSGHTLNVHIATLDGRTLMIFRALHAVMDGKGMQIWIKTICAFLRGENPQWTDSLLTEDQVLDSSPGQKRANEPVFPYAVSPRMKSEAAADAFTFSYARRSLRGTIPGIIAKLSIGVDKFLASGPEDRSLMLIPVDVRNDLDPSLNQSMANLSLPLMLPVSKGQTWSALSQQFLDMLSSKKHIARGSLDSVYQKVPARLFAWFLRTYWLSSLRRGRFMASAVISHTGRQDLGEFSSKKFDADSLVFLPCVVPIAPLGLVLTETDHGTEIAMVSANALWADPLKLLDDVIEASGFSELVIRDDHMLAKKHSPESMVFPDAHLSLHQLVERQARKAPRNVALVFAEHEMSYSEMNARANQIARLLVSRGLQKADFVGVGLERSFDVIVSILAILKAGGVYVPLDPSMPANRLEYMVDDSRARFVICSSKNAMLFAGRTEAIILDELDHELAALGHADLDLDIRPDDLCYLIYTSGSTGHPKGALNKHGALTNHFLWMANEYKLGPSDCTLQKTPISFDASLLEVFLPLQSGGRIVIARPDGHKDTRYLLELIQNHKVTFLSIVPSVFNLFLDEIDGQEESSLKLVLLGGEEFTRKLYDKFKQRFPRANAINLYGPAEAAIDTLTFDCRSGFQGRSVPIGRPIANSEIFVVDEWMQPVKVGDSGELIIAGVPIGPGYFNRPELTQEKYIAHPFNVQSPYKAYRTGDLVRQLPDGEIEFMGRIDHQVKIRGARIELGEIEHRLEQIPLLSRAVVVAKDVAGDKRLVAYWTGDATDDLRKALAKSLPEYMIPSVFMKLDALPLNANGKVDRTNLPEVHMEVSAEDIFVPSNPREKSLADIWSILLKSPVGRRTHFFEAGGNSLLAISLVVRVNSALKIKLHPQDLIENPRFDVFLSRVESLMATTAAVH
ncbi:MAG: non-ribosomal peptide synthetase [Oligoflexus sp.]|nr:non-ribosomal peptide synthetase [Oligoflexus sp.]